MPKPIFKNVDFFSKMHQYLLVHKIHTIFVPRKILENYRKGLFLSKNNKRSCVIKTFKIYKIKITGP